MDQPTPVRFPKPTKKKLVRAGKILKQCDVIRLAVEELFEKYPTMDALIEAMIRSKTAAASRK